MRRSFISRGLGSGPDPPAAEHFRMPFRGRTSTSDRRIANRQTVAYRLDVVTERGEVGCLLDLSLNGMRVKFKGEFDAGTTKELSIEFPRWLETPAERIVEGLDWRVGTDGVILFREQRTTVALRTLHAGRRFWDRDCAR